jgi:hypothetical protein
VTCSPQTDRPGPHYQGDVREIIADGWDLMIAHPPCTYIANSSSRVLSITPDRWKLMIEGALFIRDLLEAPIPRIALENPVMLHWARRIVGRSPDQQIHPWEYGHPETKRTCLWLKNLPHLKPTDDVSEVMATLPDNVRHRVHHASPSKDRGKLRSLTYLGIAEAMASQWGILDETAEAV